MRNVKWMKLVVNQAKEQKQRRVEGTIAGIHVRVCAVTLSTLCPFFSLSFFFFIIFAPIFPYTSVVVFFLISFIALEGRTTVALCCQLFCMRRTTYLWCPPLSLSL